MSNKNQYIIVIFLDLSWASALKPLKMPNNSKYTILIQDSKTVCYNAILCISPLLDNCRLLDQFYDLVLS